jgi:endonuclease YncB( thermonuclease family)
MKIKVLAIVILMFVVFLTSENYNLFLLNKSNNFDLFGTDYRIIDGDSLVLNGTRIRLEGIDAPEQKQKCKNNNETIDCGEYVTQKLKEWLVGKSIGCENLGIDRYKRVLARCFANEENINGWLVKNGLAFAYIKYSKEYLKDETNAKHRKLGLWNMELVKPWEWRKKKK